MSELETHITGLVNTGCFYFKDAAHYHYARKNTELLEDIKSYKLELPQGVKGISNVAISTETGDEDIPLGWGTSYGYEFGGIFTTTAGNSELSVKLFDSDENPLPTIDSTTSLSFDLLYYANNPIRDLLSIDPGSKSITISYTDLFGFPNSFGVNSLEENQIRLDITIGSAGLTSSATNVPHINIEARATVSIGPGYHLEIIDPLTGLSVLSKDYDTYSSTVERDDLIVDLLAADRTHLIILATADEPFTNCVGHQPLVAAIESIGGTALKFNAIENNGAYQLITIPESNIVIEKGLQTLKALTPESFIETRVLLNNGDISEILHSEYSTVELYQQSPYDDAGVLIDPLIHNYDGGTDTTQAFSLSTKRNTVALNLSTISAAQVSQNPIAVETIDSDLLEYLRLDDVIWIEFKINVNKISTSQDLPPVNNVSPGDVYEITDIADTNYGKFFVLDSTSSFVMKDFVPRTKSSIVQFTIQEVPGNPGKIRDNSSIYLKPSNGFDDLDYFSPSRTEAELPQALMTFFDGIPASSIIYTNRTKLFVEKFLDNQLILRYGDIAPPDKTLYVDYEFLGYQKLYAEGIKLNSNPKVKLMGRGLDITEGYKIYFWQMAFSYDLPSDYANNKSPIVITDLLSYATDIKETTNVEFMVEDNKIIFNRANNKIVNPSFLYGLDGWKVLDSVVVLDEDKNTSVLHDRSVRLDGKGAFISQHIPGIYSDLNYCLSFFCKGIASSVRVKMFLFNNNGTPISTPPDILVSDAFALENNSWYSPLETYIQLSDGRYYIDIPELSYVQTIEYDDLLTEETFEKVVSRAVRFNNFNKSNHKEFNLISSTSDIDIDSTDLVIEIENNSSGTEIFVDCVQFEASNNPTEFSHYYDLCTVEYETLNKSYSPRFLLTSTDNRLNKGFLALAIDSQTDDAAFTPNELTSFSNRFRTRNIVNQNHWSKMDGKDKFRHVGKFSTTRKEHEGEYFLFTTAPKPRYLHFLPEPLNVQQRLLSTSSKTPNLYVLVEDEDFNNLAGQDVRVSYGFREGSMTNSTTYTSIDDGTVAFNIPELYAETISPLVRMEEGRDYFLTLNYVASQSENYCMFDADGSYSAVLNYLSLPVSDGDTTARKYVLPIVSDPNVPEEFFEWPLELPFDIDLTNNGSVMIDYVSSIFGNQRPVSIYNRTDYKTMTVPVVLDGTSRVINLDYTVLNPIEGSITIKNPLNRLVSYKESNDPISSSNTFYFDRENSQIIINDSNINSVEITYLDSYVFISPTDKRKIYIHRSVIFKLISELYNEIENSSLKDQHNIGLPSELASVDKMEPLDFPLFIRLSYNVSLYLKAQSWTSKTESKVVYTHSRALI